MLHPLQHKNISIHALREEGDERRGSSPGVFIIFLSTPSARRATLTDLTAYALHKVISIHALREEGDRHPLFRAHKAPCISIHALREEGD